ncbi:MAG: hypothetical protein ACMXYK_03655 [Candidatus Woesearchaeota archaeon]
MISDKQLLILKTIEKKEVTFNQLKNVLNFRSNSLAYHLNVLKHKHMIAVIAEKYILTQYAKSIFPYLTLERNPVFTVVATAIVYDGNVYGQIKPREPSKGSKIFFGSKVPSNMPVTVAAKMFAESGSGVPLYNLKLRFINEYFENGHWMVYFFTAESKEKPTGIVIKHTDKDLFGDTGLLLENIGNRSVKCNLS